MQDSDYTFCPTSAEWAELEAMKEFLSIFNTGKFSCSFLHFSLLCLQIFFILLNHSLATLKLCVTRHPTAHLLYRNMTTIDHHLKKISQTGPEHIAQLIEPMKEKYDKYWTKMKDVAAMMAVLDPQYKFDLVEFALLMKPGSNNT